MPAVIAAILFAVAFLLANIPGNPVVGPNARISCYTFGRHFVCSVEELVHGWPLPYLRHQGYYTPFGEGPSAWKVGDNAQFTPAALGANVVLLAVGTFVIGWLVRRRIQKEGWRFGISHMLLAVLCISVVMAYASSRYRLHQAQVAIIQRTHPDIRGPWEWQPFGPYWLRSITGPSYWNWGDCLVGADIAHSDEIAELPGRSAIKRLRIYTVKCDTMASLNDFHNLFAIHMSWVDFGYSNFYGDGKPEFWACLRLILK